MSHTFGRGVWQLLSRHILWRRDHIGSLHLLLTQHLRGCGVGVWREDGRVLHVPRGDHVLVRRRGAPHHPCHLRSAGVHPVVLLHVVLPRHAVRLETRLVYEGCLHHVSLRVIGRQVDVGGLLVHLSVPWLRHPGHVHPGGHLLASSVHGDHLVVMVDPHGGLVVVPGHHGVAVHPRVHHLTLPHLHHPRLTTHHVPRVHHLSWEGAHIGAGSWMM